MISDQVERDRWNGEKLKREVLDRRLRFSVREEICVNDSAVDIGKMGGCFLEVRHELTTIRMVRLTHG